MLLRELNIGSSLYKYGDISIDINRKCKPIIVSDAHHLPFRKGTFLRVISHHILEHITSPLKALIEISYVLKKGGGAEIIVYYSLYEAFHKKLGKDHYSLFAHINLFTKESLLSLCKKANLKVVGIYRQSLHG
ncbi:hypothetical protein HRbin06_00628 [archaeon HR06]|nr:hypothetical protein HRbin06_00628 [archaeon HR06]